MSHTNRYRRNYLYRWKNTRYKCKMRPGIYVRFYSIVFLFNYINSFMEIKHTRPELTCKHIDTLAPCAWVSRVHALNMVSKLNYKLNALLIKYYATSDSPYKHHQNSIQHAWPLGLTTYIIYIAVPPGSQQDISMQIDHGSTRLTRGL
jgi:hypothetical protein